MLLPKIREGRVIVLNAFNLLLNGFLLQFYSPLMHACEEGHIEAVKVLLDNGAKVGLIAGQPKSKSKKKSVRFANILFVGPAHHIGIIILKKIIGSRMNAMHVACTSGRRAGVVELLISKAGKDIKNVLNAKTKVSNTILPIVLILVKCEQDKWTPLMYAVREGHTEVVKVLLKQDTLDILPTNKVRVKCLLCLVSILCFYIYVERPDGTSYRWPARSTGVSQIDPCHSGRASRCSGEVGNN